MLDKLDSMVNFYNQALSLREQRQQILSANIANNDTPHYQARDIDFAQELKKALNMTQVAPVTQTQLTTSDTHHFAVAQQGNVSAELDLLYRVPFQPSADGNTVDMDKERVEFLDNSLHYQSNLTFLSGKFKSLISVMQEG